MDFAYDPPIPNVQGIVFNANEAAFLGDYLAAAMADIKDPTDPKIGYVGGIQIPPVEQFIVAYEKDMEYYNQKYGKKVQLLGIYVGDFEAPDQGKIKANSLITGTIDAGWSPK